MFRRFRRVDGREDLLPGYKMGTEGIRITQKTKLYLLEILSENLLRMFHQQVTKEPGKELVR